MKTLNGINIGVALAALGILTMASIAIATAIDSGNFLTWENGSNGQLGDSAESEHSTVFQQITMDSISEEWNNTYGNGVIRSVEQTKDGGYILSGDNGGSYPDNSRGLLIKADSNGKEQWRFVSNYPVCCSDTFVQQTADGGYIFGAGDRIFKIDQSGKEQWNNIFGYPIYTIDTFVNAGQQTSDGGYIFAGSAGKNVLLVKTYSDGSGQWNRIFSGSVKSMQQTYDGGYILAGQSSFGTVWLSKTDSNGVEKWSITGTKESYLTSVKQTSDEGYIITGSGKYSDCAGDNFNIFLGEINSSGKTQWEKTFSLSQCEDFGNSVSITSDGGYIISGETTATTVNSGSWTAWAIRTDSSGNEQWNMTFPVPGNYESIFYSGKQTSDGGYILAGETSSSISGPKTWLLKLPAAGPIPVSTTIPTPVPIGPVHNVNKGTNYTTIQAAVDDANPDEEIRVDSGIYYENVNVTKRLTMRGTGMSVVNASGSGNAITLSADGIGLDGFVTTGTYKYNAGIKIASSSNKLNRNNVYLNNIGIMLYCSRNNMLTDNTVSNNNVSVLIDNSTNNILKDNSIFSGQLGMDIADHSMNNSIYENNITNNTIAIGFELPGNNNNTIYHNNFVNNEHQVTQSSVNYNITNQWYSTYPSGGNYWSDYTGVDLKSGSGQNIQGSDGIGDFPYNINDGTGARDMYPFVQQNGWKYSVSVPIPTATPVPIPTPIPTSIVRIKGDVNGDGQVTIVDALLIAQHTVGIIILTGAQFTSADVNGDSHVTIVDALLIAQYTVGMITL